ncbi:hypothetical protein BGX29_011414 [Mortierella sp. GBA35]|nr:hypothetical protein BGX29_011414 [Mortierella sp. GBA35]
MAPPLIPRQTLNKALPPFLTLAEELNAANILSCLRQTHSIEWRLLSQYRVRRQAGSNYSASPPSAQIPLWSLGTLFRLAPNLTRLSLIMVQHDPEENVVQSVFNVANLPNLRVLDLDLPPNNTPDTSSMTIEKLFPLFVILEELTLRGVWYDEQDQNPQGLTFPSYAPWRLKRLTVDRVDVFFFQHCPALESLKFENPMKRFRWGSARLVRRTMLASLQGMPKLRMITVGNPTDHTENDFEVQDPIGPCAPLWKMAGALQEDSDWTLQDVVELFLRHLRTLKTPYLVEHMDIHHRTTMVHSNPTLDNAREKQWELFPQQGIWVCRNLEILRLQVHGHGPYFSSSLARNRVLYGYISAVCPRLVELKLETTIICSTDIRTITGTHFTGELSSGLCLLSRLRFLERLCVVIGGRGQLEPAVLNWFYDSGRTVESRKRRRAIVDSWSSDLQKEAELEVGRLSALTDDSDGGGGYDLLAEPGFEDAQLMDQLRNLGLLLDCLPSLQWLACGQILERSPEEEVRFRVKHSIFEQLRKKTWWGK